MSQVLINRYLRELSTLRRVSGSSNEGVVSEAFKDLLKDWGRAQELQFVAQFAFTAPDQSRRFADGALVYPGVRLPFGYYEAKDTKDDLDREIEKKFAVGYPRDNIIFEDSRTAVLIQDGTERRRCGVEDVDALQGLLDQFFGYQRPEFADFAKARKQFRQDLPQVLDALREAIEEAEKNNAAYRAAAAEFLDQARSAINPRVAEGDVREMLIQHILTEDIFNHVFDQTGYHRENNVAQALSKLEATFFKGELRQRTVERLKSYYSGLRASAARLESRTEKQKLLKDVYEDFYKTYNPKAADRLGVVYTPGEIVRFMIESADWLCERHFGRTMIHPDVEILDPATGTGTFVVELLEHFAGQAGFKEKYANGLHANEVAILPYYVANLNIEATYKALTGDYAEFPGLCFVDTLDNIGGFREIGATQRGLIGSVSGENNERINRQNARKISVVIGNPPYNAWQENYNQGNANVKYDVVDSRIKESYVRLGTAQNQNSVYDMYTRFVRWATDRIGDKGVVAYVMGRKPFSKAAYDGFRQTIWREFSDIYIVDLGGDVRDNPKISGTKHNVFGIQTGVAVAFLVRSGRVGEAVIRYVRRPEFETAVEKLSWLSATESIEHAGLETIQPDKKNDWLNKTVNEWGAWTPLVARDGAQTGQSIFELQSRGLATQRDEWVYDVDRDTLVAKAEVLVAGYEATRLDPSSPDRATIKWDRELERYRAKDVAKNFDDTRIVKVQYRPFTTAWAYFDPHFNGMTYQLPRIFTGAANPTIAYLGIASLNPLAVFAVDELFDLCLLKFGNGGTQGVSRYRYANGERLDNITDWALTQFQTHYPDAAVTKDDIFAYVYAVLHDPVYRETYALNLRREFPRIPFYPDFARWRDWGRTLLDLHIGYEGVDPFDLTRVETPLKRGRALKAGEGYDLLDETRTPTLPLDGREDGVGGDGAGGPVMGGGDVGHGSTLAASRPVPPVEREGGRVAPKPILKSKPDEGAIVLDAATTLTGVPAQAWTYRLGNRSAIDWVLDQHKEKTPKDPTIRARFNTYRFVDHKERVIDLLARVVRVSVDTVAITEAMKTAKR